MRIRKFQFLLNHSGVKKSREPRLSFNLADTSAKCVYCMMHRRRRRRKRKRRKRMGFLAIADQRLGCQSLLHFLAKEER